MTVVIDASAVVAALVDSGPDGQWAETLLTSRLAAPHLLPVEVANVLRRAVQAGELTADIASLAHADLLDLRVELVSYDSVAARVWELRHNLTTYDAWYVAVAELLDAPLATLDQRLVLAPGPTCSFRTPRD
ncbi:MAG: type II toxin-antitoxin system VapC family toxin [Acidimicrobiales bacterium]